MATGIAVTNTTVYYGPSTSLYPSEGSSVGPNETVTILWQEGNWYYIEYFVGTTTTRKRMYIQTTKLSSISGSVPSKTLSGTTKTSSPATTYTGPGTGYAVAGSVGTESVTAFNEVSGNYTFIEYNISGGQRKRAYIDSNKLTIPGTSKIIKDPISPSANFTGNDHTDYGVSTGTPVYAMCDGTFRFAYIWGKKYQTSSDSYLSLGRGTRLTPDSGWKTADGRTPSYIEYGHLSRLNGYSTPNYVERCQGSESGTNYSESTVVLANKAVKCGDLIGYSGNSGNTYGVTGEHLHIQLR